MFLLQDLNAAFSKKNLLLTAAIGAPAGTIDVAYDIPAMYKYLVSRLRLGNRLFSLISYVKK